VRTHFESEGTGVVSVLDMRACAGSLSRTKCESLQRTEGPAPAAQPVPYTLHCSGALPTNTIAVRALSVRAGCCTGSVLSPHDRGGETLDQYGKHWFFRFKVRGLGFLTVLS